MGFKSEYGQLLEDRNLARWYSNLSKGSIIVAQVYLRRLGSFCKQLGISPGEYVKLPLRKMEDVAQDFIEAMENAKSEDGGQKFAPSYVQSHLKAVKSWAEWNRKGLRRRIKIANLGRRPSLSEERAPTKEELRRVLYNDKTSLRTRACIALVAFAGVRLEVLGDFLGSDGLKIADFSELEIKGNKVHFTKTPAMITVREELNKSRHRYLTFLGEEGCEILKQYLEARIREGEKVVLGSAVIGTSPLQAEKARRFEITDKSQFLRTTKIGDSIRKSMRRVELPWRPYVFRTYFDTALMLAESKGLVSHAYQQFWMGHKGDIEAQYTTRKNHFPEKVIEDMREAYEKAQELIQTTKAEETSMEKFDRRLDQRILEMAGYKQDEIEKMVPGMTDEQIMKAAREKFFGSMVNNGARQKVIPINEVESFISNGWEYVAQLPDSKAILKLPL
ncbi:MAG: site-specific integrase [Thaumarchaeota archaeon]|nr:site-specific integrase [Nitrososphaerota archaeon]